MKIGILTHQYINNYGAFLQAWALREAIAELFPNDEVQIIDYVNLKHWIKHFLEKGDMSANEIYCRLDNEGVSKRVARMVKTEMGIHCYQKKRRWYWSVQPEEGAVNGPQV